MRTIWKYQPGQIFGDRFKLDIPIDGKLLTVELQDNKLTMWFEVESNSIKSGRIFHIFPTGGEIPSDSDKIYFYRKTYLSGSYVWHVYEVIS